MLEVSTIFEKKQEIESFQVSVKPDRIGQRMYSAVTAEYVQKNRVSQSIGQDSCHPRIQNRVLNFYSKGLIEIAIQDIKDCREALIKNQNCNCLILKVFESYCKNSEAAIQEELLKLCDAILFFESESWGGYLNVYLNEPIRERAFAIIELLTASANYPFASHLTSFLNKMANYRTNHMIQECHACVLGDYLFIHKVIEDHLENSLSNSNIAKLNFISSVLLRDCRIHSFIIINILRCIFQDAVENDDKVVQKELFYIYREILFSDCIDNLHLRKFVYNSLSDLIRWDSAGLEIDFYDFLKEIDLESLCETQNKELQDIILLFSLFHTLVQRKPYQNLLFEKVSELFGFNWIKTPQVVKCKVFLLKQLLELGFPHDLDIVDPKKKRKIFYLLGFSENNEKVLALFRQYFCPRIVKEFEDFKKIKLLGLKIGLDKLLSQSKGFMSGCYQMTSTLPDAIISLKSFKEKVKDREFCEILESSINLLEKTYFIEDVINVSLWSIINEEKPLFIGINSKKHAINLVIKNPYLAICNRGYGARYFDNSDKHVYGIELYPFEVKKKTPEQLNILFSSILAIRYSEVETILGPRVGYYKASHQLDDNCASASLKMGILASFFLTKISKKDLTYRVDNDLSVVFEDRVKLYKSWSLDSRLESFASYENQDVIKALSSVKIAVSVYKRRGAKWLSRYVGSGRLLHANVVQVLAQKSIHSILEEIKAKCPDSFLSDFCACNEYQVA